MPTQIKLALIAGGTIFLGLPVAKIPNVSARTKGFLNAVSTGVLIFILVEIMGKAIESIEDLFQAARGGFPQMTNALSFSGMLILGLLVGLLSMVYFENAFIRQGKDKTPQEEAQASRLSLMIAIGIGIHNLTEGLAIAQANAFGDEILGLFLAVGFALHNATEGFGIAAPLSGQRPSWAFLGLMGLIGGGPTVIGAVLGSYWQSSIFQFLSFGLAAGSILYIVGELMHMGRRLKGEAVVEIGLLIGFASAFATEMYLAVVGNG